ncbi:MAG TPA: sigma-70 family RNA polymerase sigma factor [Polyangiaceae bacterium]
MPAEMILIARAQSGEETALEELITRIRPHVEHQLMRYPVSDEDRRDLLQMTLLQVVRRLGSFRGESSFSTWLFRVTANEALMLMRSQRRQRARLVEGLDLEDLGSITAARASTDESHEARTRTECENVLREALAELPEDYRHIVVAHYHEDKGLQEIADKLCVTESAVRSRLHRARSRLRAILENTPVAPNEAKAGEAA